jgi:hypothetical protein
MNTVQCLLTANCAEISKAQDRNGNQVSINSEFKKHRFYSTIYSYIQKVATFAVPDFLSLRGFDTALNKREMVITDNNDHMANVTNVPDPTMELQPHFGKEE